VFHNLFLFHDPIDVLKYIHDSFFSYTYIII